MRVAMYYNNKDIRVEEVPIPEIGPGELLLRVEASGICGSDVMEWYRINKAPLVLGHEVAGEVVEVGEGVDRYKKGDRIVASHHVPCNTCRFCLAGHHTVCDTLRCTNFDPGGFAEFVRLPGINVDRGVYPIPESVSFEEASFAEPLACVLRAQRIAGLRPGETVMVIGSGIAGLLHIQLARAMGAGRVIATDISEARLQAARKFGADATIHAEEDILSALRRVNNGWLADKVLVCTGARSANLQALELVERGGSVLFFAPTDTGVTIPVSINDLFFRNDITLTTSYAGSPADHVTALELIRARRVSVGNMITHRLGLAETSKGFQLVAEAQDSIKVIIEPQK
ncbi:MAG: alcohol dehydrogenase catalytic domain-containing protein [Deltaproteobacteria bacterium]|nr:alcohol dehydrogenase catalytic domain-containing protein [Deltaproteobacteria bacterium]MBW2073415.1 alcohol dehydrogenase catalytic domain-containing protein [Deltaproteobacteria bacterium]